MTNISYYVIYYEKFRKVMQQTEEAFQQEQTFNVREENHIHESMLFGIPKSLLCHHHQLLHFIC